MILPLFDDKHLWGRVVLDGECWIWTGYKQGGYGRITRGGSQLYTHRYVYERLFGKLSDDVCLDHNCRNRACVNPLHLEPVSWKENVLRGVGMGALNKRKKLCANGHKFDIFLPNGHRQCKTCRDEVIRKRQSRRMEVSLASL